MPYTQSIASRTAGSQTQISYLEFSNLFIEGLYFQKQTNRKTGSRISPLKCPKVFYVKVNCEKLR